MKTESKRIKANGVALIIQDLFRIRDEIAILRSEIELQYPEWQDGGNIPGEYIFWKINDNVSAIVGELLQAEFNAGRVTFGETEEQKLLTTSN